MKSVCELEVAQKGKYELRRRIVRQDKRSYLHR